jgi:ATP/maltotriose-dependent transcriptional regulator MalT
MPSGWYFRGFRPIKPREQRNGILPRQARAALAVGDDVGAQRFCERALTQVADGKGAMDRARVVAEAAEVWARLGRIDEARALIAEAEGWRTQFGSTDQAPWVQRIAVAKAAPESR